MALQDITSPFVWGAGGARKTPEQIARDREIAAALLKEGVDFSPIASPLQGLARVANAAAGAYGDYRANQAETANTETSRDIVARMLSGAGPQQFPAAPTAGGDASASPVAYEPNGNEVRDGIISTANALGIDPVDLGTAISYETAGTFDPTKAGPTTQWGQHKGLIQFGEPQAARFGVDWNNPVASQLGPDGAVAKYLTDAGVKPGMGMLDIYSAINAGRVGRYNASDANNGGAPGTVWDKVEQQMAGHRAKAMALLGDAGQAPAVAAVNALAEGQPTQVASLDPSAGMAQAAPALPPPTEIQDRPVAQVAQALSGPDLPHIPVTAGGNAGVYQPGQGGGINPAIIEALSSPYADDQTKRIAGLLLGQQMEAQQQASDPLRQLQIEKARREMQMGQPLINAGGGAIYNPNTGEWLTAPNDGQTELPSRVREYEYAKSQGFPGSFNDWLASQKGGMSLSVDPNTGQVTFQQGGNIKPMTEGQSKDATFATRAEGALGVLDAPTDPNSPGSPPLSDALTNLPQSVGGQVPVVGNYAKSPEYQRAEQAGREFLQAILRKDTGAAITKEETAEYGSVYLPQPGDSPAVLQQKKVSRTRAIEALKAGMTPQAILAQEKALKNTNDAAKKPPTVIDGYTIEEVQ